MNKRPPKLIRDGDHYFEKRNPNSMREPSVPSNPLQSPELRILLGLIEEAIGTVGAFETAIMREEARAAGHLSAAPRYLGHEHPLLPVFSLGPEQAVDRLIGNYDEKGDFQPGMAALTKREQEAMRFTIAGLEPWETAQAMTSGKQRRAGGVLAVKTVDEHLRSAKAKLLKLMMEDAAMVNEGSNYVVPDEPKQEDDDFLAGKQACQDEAEACEVCQ